MVLLPKCQKKDKKLTVLMKYQPVLLPAFTLLFDVNAWNLAPPVALLSLTVT